MENELKDEIEKYKDYLFIVEGNKDFRALNELGIKNIFVLNRHNKSLKERVEDIEEMASKKIICILTDFDKTGEKLFSQLVSELSLKKVKIDNSFRYFLKKIKISHIEGLATFSSNL